MFMRIKVTFGRKGFFNKSYSYFGNVADANAFVMLWTEDKNNYAEKPVIVFIDENTKKEIERK